MSETSYCDDACIRRIEETEQGKMAVIELHLGQEVLHEVREAAQDLGWPIDELVPCLVFEGLEARRGS